MSRSGNYVVKLNDPFNAGENSKAVEYEIVWLERKQMLRDPG